MAIESLLALMIFIATMGFIGRERFQDNPFAMGFVILLTVISTVGTVYFARDWVQSIIDERIRSEPAPRNLGLPNAPIQKDPTTPQHQNLTQPAPATRFGNPEKTTAPKPSPQKELMRRRLFDALIVEDISVPAKSDLPFPSTYFERRLNEELGDAETDIPQIRLGAAFVEPYDHRSLAYAGTITGHIVVSLPAVPSCSLVFGDQTYSFANPATGIMKSINDHISHIANWVQRASRGGTLTCPD